MLKFLSNSVFRYPIIAIYFAMNSLIPYSGVGNFAISMYKQTGTRS